MSAVKRELEDAEETSSEAKLSKVTDVPEPEVPSLCTNGTVHSAEAPSPANSSEIKPPAKSAKARKKAKQKENRRKRAAANWERYKGIKPDNKYEANTPEARSDRTGDEDEVDNAERKKKKRMCAVFLSYSGKGYHGLQM